ncbi:esterase family protein [Bdellovibrio sp. SKB1291214]|uniref:alpha/beta hydrolase-fold protein n=1 Tax=Bdellovibrio sp. SKB1291214 TaxID=1732569 RepID=UPI001594E7B9|nr:alpha/beta hydrolase-fold protein [Bdellovibrio sp. SKB1291214]UYL10682.1 esterase family protein [Bdellovibrio sp. SKB1291214]
MKCLILIIPLVLISPFTFANSDKCQPLDVQALNIKIFATRCFSTSFYSESLKKNVGYNVIVPPGYVHDGSMKYPYAIFLHGRGGDKDSLNYSGGIEAYDQVVRNGGRTFLIFSPSGQSHYWMNGAISKVMMADMVTKDLLKQIESQYPVIKDEPCDRALFGISMGGNGVVRLALSNPKLVCSVFAMSPVFRTPNEIWTPGSNSKEPKEDYYSYGVGKDFEERSARHICQKLKKPGSDKCLPVKNFELEIGSTDAFLKSTPDTKIFIEELAKAHPEFKIGIKDCDQKEVCEKHKDCNSHAGTYWNCRMPYVMKWLSEHFK